MGKGAVKSQPHNKHALKNTPKKNLRRKIAKGHCVFDLFHQNSGYIKVML
jgi:hypothetical protein